MHIERLKLFNERDDEQVSESENELTTVLDDVPTTLADDDDLFSSANTSPASVEADGPMHLLNDNSDANVSVQSEIRDLLPSTDKKDLPWATKRRRKIPTHLRDFFTSFFRSVSKQKLTDARNCFQFIGTMPDELNDNPWDIGKTCHVRSK